MWYKTVTQDRRDPVFRNILRRLLWGLFALPRLGVLVSLVAWTILLLSTLHGFGRSSQGSPISVNRCNAAPILLTQSAPGSG